MCRDCQRSPAVQLRVFLTRARAQGMEFSVAWSWAMQRVRWPHDKNNRQDWKKVLGKLDVQETFRASYEYKASGERERHLANLELVA